MRLLIACALTIIGILPTTYARADSCILSLLKKITPVQAFKIEWRGEVKEIKTNGNPYSGSGRRASQLLQKYAAEISPDTYMKLSLYLIRDGTDFWTYRPSLIQRAGANFGIGYMGDMAVRRIRNQNGQSTEDLDALSTFHAMAMVGVFGAILSNSSAAHISPQQTHLLTEAMWTRLSEVEELVKGPGVTRDMDYMTIFNNLSNIVKSYDQIK